MVPATLIEVSLTLASCFFILAISGVKATNPFIVPNITDYFGENNKMRSNKTDYWAVRLLLYNW